MTTSQIGDQAKNRLQAAIGRFQEDLKKLRTGRAHPSMLDGVQAAAYGVTMPLNQLSTISAPEPQLLQITPFDPSNIHAISDAIRNDQSLGLNPMDDGRVVRVPIPPLTTERRTAIVKQMNEKLEEAHISCRNIRHEALDEAKKAKADKEIGEDEFARFEKTIDDLMSKAKVELEGHAKAKEQEIMTV